MAEPIVIGDIHGNFRQLSALIGHIGVSGRPLIFLGDYVNRGPNAKEVVDFLIQLEKTRKNVTFLCGNHDWAFLQYLESGKLDRFAMLGGLQTLSSYLPTPLGDGVHAAILNLIPKSHLEFFKNLRPYFEDHNIVCSHAGIPEGRPNERSFHELVLASHPQLFATHFSWDKLNICGHYPQRNLVPFHRGTFICLDTGCGTLPSGRLSALFYPEIRFLQVAESGLAHWLNT